MNTFFMFTLLFIFLAGMICAFFCGMQSFKQNGQERKSTMFHQLTSIGIVGFPFLIIIVCHILIYVKIRQSRHELTTFGSILSRRNEIRYFRMTLLVVGFITCSMLSIFLSDMFNSARDAGKNSLFKMYDAQFTDPNFENNADGGWINFLLYVNGFLPFWINPFIYVASNKNYRKAYIKVFRENIDKSRMSYSVYH